MQNKILQDHFENPRNVGILEHPDAVGTAENPVCGDRIQLMLHIKEGHIQEARFKTFGCPAAIACSSVLMELILQKSLQEASNISAEMVAQHLGGLPSIQYHCAHLVREALQKAIRLLHH